MSKIQVGILFGGASSEHEISCVSAGNILKHLNNQKYDVVCIGIQKNGDFFLYTGDAEAISKAEFTDPNQCIPCIIGKQGDHRGVFLLADCGQKQIPLDVVIPVLHGKNGEDGTVQGLLELAQIPYVGCDVLSSAICMDKAVTHTILEQAGIPMAEWVALHREVPVPQLVSNIVERFGFPVFVKPANAGSSVGVSKVKNQAELQPALERAFLEDKKLLIEKAIVGQEVECAVLGVLDPLVSTPGEIKPAHEFYDYDAKYHSQDSILCIPAEIGEDTAKKVQSLAKKAFLTMGCKGLSRVDFFVTPQGEIFLNEINTFPGFTGNSMYPMLIKEMGIEQSVLLDELIDYAMAYV